MLILIMSLFVISSSCSVYTSQGRKLFEARAPGSIVNGNAGMSVKLDCWIQPATDPLWRNIEPDFITTDFSKDYLEVCVKDDNTRPPLHLDNDHDR